jgi:hypothetical protein
LIIRLSLYESLKAYAGDPLALATWKPSVLANTAYYATQFLYIFLAGVLLRTLVEYLNGRPASRLRLRLATALFLVSAASMVVLLCLGMKQTSIFLLQGNPLGVLMGTPVDLLVIAFFASAVLGSPLLGAVLKWRFLAFYRDDQLFAVSPAQFGDQIIDPLVLLFLFCTPEGGTTGSFDRR